ncbi:MAG: HlyD family efflux transporter periplasmic adaptor subunit [Candidatus Eisenbacteria bacterium]|nr:HlyD family efflux transporter periplasmic adaptor subunit [Candidatus Eisenbacteria bacterium]
MIPKPVRIVVPLLIVAAVATVVVLRLRGDGGAVAASGTVEATDAQLGFQAPGRIESIAVREGETVRTGAELAVLDRAEAVARLQQAEAQRDAARAALDELEKGFRSEEVAQARDGLVAAGRRLADAKSDLDRTSRLRGDGAVSEQALDKAQVAFDVAKSQHSQAREQMQLMQAGPRKERIAAQRAQLAQAEAAVRGLRATLDNMTVRAPFDGVITVRHREPGEVLGAGSPVLTLMNPADRWVRIYVREDRVGAVRLGQPAAITSDTYRGKKYEGRVVFIASEAEFTPKSVQTAEERVKLVYAVKVQIDGDPRHELKPGMPADVRLESPRR